ncbi:uncharacterized protein TRIADDRAFT_53430 [Trichoplax adhaerens]|uniref:Uncharacterized protein n=1 Tax=Trichoplax adhaerens TaxID=10228 RepID=B3RP75_TRIAD|nr:hypothetical protein TRIADDRAFT_53430 [Trichoplax adhaerens]EDV27585.1 hypothetical protein TRIADDRAFT_53430 [Trichoplax adhaerens]|eukprot:XP_002109419.1 hypothetical protein TRIADDRAFT_53430 [Trichoplax adhaerens]
MGTIVSTQKDGLRSLPSHRTFLSSNAIDFQKEITKTSFPHYQYKTANEGYIAQKTKSFVARLPPVDHPVLDNLNHFDDDYAAIPPKNKVHVTFIDNKNTDQNFNPTASEYPAAVNKIAYNTAIELNAQRWYGGQVLQPYTPSTAQLELGKRINDDYVHHNSDGLEGDHLHRTGIANDELNRSSKEDKLLYTYLRGDAVQLERYPKGNIIKSRINEYANAVKNFNSSKLKSHQNNINGQDSDESPRDGIKTKLLTLDDLEPAYTRDIILTPRVLQNGSNRSGSRSKNRQSNSQGSASRRSSGRMATAGEGRKNIRGYSTRDSASRLGKNDYKQSSPKTGRRSRAGSPSKVNGGSQKELSQSPASRQNNDSAASHESSRESSPYRRIRSTSPVGKSNIDHTTSNNKSLLPRSKFTESNEARKLRHETLKMLADDSIALGDNLRSDFVQYQNEIERLRYHAEVHYELSLGENFNPPRVVDFQKATFDSLIEEINKRVNQYKDGCRIKSLALYCKGGPGYIYFLRNEVITDKKLVYNDPIAQFFRDVSRIMSKLGPNVTSVHVMGCNLTGTSSGHELLQLIQKVMEPTKLTISAPVEQSQAGSEMISQYFDIKKYREWKDKTTSFIYSKRFSKRKLHLKF